MAAQLGGQVSEMFVPFSIGEVEVLQPLQTHCFSYVSVVKDEGKRESSRVLKSNVVIVDEAGKVLVRINESVGVPLREVHKKPAVETDADGFSRLYYAYDWENAPLTADSPLDAARSVVLFDTGETMRDRYRARFAAAGGNPDRVVLVRPGAQFEDLGGNAYAIDPTSKSDFTRLFQTLLDRGFPVENLCFRWGTGHTDLRDETLLQTALDHGVYALLYLCQSLVELKLDSNARLLYLFTTRTDEPQPHNEAVTGFVNTLRLELPKLSCKTLEIREEQAGDEQIVDAVAAEFAAPAQDANAVRYDGRERSIRKLKAFSLAEAPVDGARIKEHGVYLITGGAGGLGLVFAEHLSRTYNARIVLTGRSPLSPEREAKLQQLRELGGDVRYVAADVSKRDEVERLLAETRAQFGTLNGVIHAAGVLRDSLVRNKTADEMRAVFAPKVAGTLHLDDLTKHDPLDLFVTFSSLAAVAGNAGQCDYSFANHFMDSLAAQRELLRLRGTRSGKTLSVNWSLWADGGMKLDEQTALYFRKTLGVSPLSAAAGLDAFTRGLASARTQFAALEGVQEKVEIAWGLKKKQAAPAATPSSPAVKQAASAGTGDLREPLLNDLSKIVMEFLKLEATDVAPDKILLDLGFDSIGLTTFANAVNEKYQLDITPVLFFDYPSLNEISNYLATERKEEIARFYGGSASAAATTSSAERQVPAAIAPADQPAMLTIRKGWNPDSVQPSAALQSSVTAFAAEDRFANEPIAIVGMSGVMPQSEDLDEFWENLKSSTDMVSLIPEDRWKWEDYFGDPLKEANKSNSKWGGFMKEVDKFDPLFFGISPREAQMMDPQQRIFLETVWKTIEDSGQKVSDLSGTKTGLFVGVATNDYIDLLNDREVVLDGYTASGNSHSVLANRISFLLNLRGPSAPIDTACSSSLVALHRAIESIHTRSCDMAIVGGVQVMLSPAAYISFGAAGMLSSDGKCKTFDKRANGYVRGEGSGAIFLKRLSAAEPDGNHIYAVIRATAENHGGRVTTLTAPNSSAQAELLVEAYDKARIDPGTVGYIECHGTGTSLGDPIEIQALTKGFAELYKKNNKAPAATPHCGLSAVKTNIGHLETAAGIAGVLKALLAIKNKQIPANLHFEEVNPYINLKGTPFYIADKLTPWAAPVDADGTLLPRRAGVSSFGFGGANAHIVLEEYIPASRVNPVVSDVPRIVVLSAKNEERLQAYVRSTLAYLAKSDAALADLAYTLQVGRDEMAERLALVASTNEELKQKLQDVLSGTLPRDAYRNNVAKNAKADPVAAAPAVEALIEQNDLSRLAERWAAGAKVDWRLLYRNGLPRRISAPTYPFARERHWVPAGQAKMPKAAGLPAVTTLHPLVHRNTSTLEQQKFSSRLSNDAFYLADHVVETQSILPGVAYLEMARAAGALSGDAAVRVLRNVTWERPLIVGSEPRDVEVTLEPAKEEVKFTVRSGSGAAAVTHCTGRLGYQADAAAPARLDIAAIRARCSEEVLTGAELYPYLSGAGLRLGSSFQIVQSISATESESLAVLKLPEHLAADADQFWLHPALMDGSLHTAIGLARKNGIDLSANLPYSVGEVQILHPLRDLHYGYATWAGENPKANPNILKVTFHLLDQEGNVLVRIKDFVSRPFLAPGAKAAAAAEKQPPVSVAPDESTVGLQSLLPVWNRVRRDPSAHASHSGDLLLLGGDEAQLAWVRAFNPGAQSMRTGAAATVDEIANELRDRPFDQLLWIAPDAHNNVQSDAAAHNTDALIEQQEHGVLNLFRTIKALLQLGHGPKKLQWTIVTTRTQRVDERHPMQPSHAGVVGLVGSLAKEYPQWDLRLLDVDTLDSVTARECLSLPFDKQGNVLAHRDGEWFEQGLARIAALPQAPSAYRKNGVYVVIGGAGGVGEVWSRFMIEHYQANIVWIGRRERTSEIDRKIDALSQLGPAPLYITADASDVNALREARRAILEAYPAIHGVVQSAIVLQDQSLARMDEAAFRASLSAKVDVSVNMDRVFGDEELDFMLFFSSVISFVKSPGQSNYSAGCTFKDSFAHELQQRRAYRVRIMNWGYWGTVGIVADESYNRMMAQMGIGSIESNEGMASLEVLLGSGMRQMALLKTLSAQATAGLNVSETVAWYPETSPATLPQVAAVLAERVSGQPVAALKADLPTPEMTAFVAELLASTLFSVGLFRNGVPSIAALGLQKPPAPHYERWLESSVRYLQAENILTADLTDGSGVRSLSELWAEWEAKRSQWGTAPNLQAQIALLEACLRALPDVLTGKRLATDVMFPSSSMHLVEGVYRDNTLADHFNDILGQTLAACIEQQLATEPDRKIRIVEIGAGTGGTTAQLLPVLQRFPVVEYCYTDVSRAFLMYAEKHFKPRLPALTTAIFDVTKPLAGQAIAADHYDFAIAANVLHATPDIRETLRNAKAALKNNGVLLLNEISTWSLFNHLTFGLLEGWWLHEDSAVRLPGSPGLAPQAWRDVLSEEGFESIAFPAEETQELGQQIVAAASNGWTRQRVVKAVQPARTATQAVAAPVAVTAAKTANPATTSASAERNDQMSLDHVRRLITENLAEALRMEVAAIRSDAPFADYGVDSIIGVNFVRTVSEALQIELETTSLFEYSTVDQLAEYIQKNWRDEIAARLGQTTIDEVVSTPEIVAAPIEVKVRGAHRFMAHESLPGASGALTVNPDESGAMAVEPIAIIGMSGRFAESETLDAFWQNLAEGKNLVKEVSRWAADDCVMSDAPDRAYCSQGSFIGSIDQFDPAFFGISAEEAMCMDPQQRLFLEESWKALEDAGYGGKSVHEKQCGVYAGCGSSNYDRLAVEDPPAQAFWGNSQAVLPARIAYHLNLQGPAIAVDTACSSSLVTIHLACQGLWSRETDMALAGGVFLQATPGFFQVANRAGMLSPDGKCYSFDARANGFVPGEGVGVVVLKRLRDALRDGDYIHGVIAGSGINQDGKSNGLIAPNGRAQERLERAVYEKFGIHPESIQVVEAHATGTILGDSVEYSAISRTFRDSTDKQQFCAIGTVKTNIGHAATAAGV
ncbi:MAG TPA: SDR family NAD(P)-dependent oxidoreductase, partial [Thermoanaerobaculia bacterium]